MKQPELAFENARKDMLDKTAICQQMSSDREALLFSGMRANRHLPHPIYIQSGNGPYIIDMDGNEYIDTCMGFGVGVLGHGHPDISTAIDRIARFGWHFGIHSQEQLPLARMLQRAIPCAERLLFCNTGSEATGYVMRAARAFTGKEKVGVFDGNWHGMHDYCLVAPSPEVSRDRPTGVAIGSGVPKAVHDLIVPLPYRNPSALDIIRENKDELAMVIIEPVQHSNPHPDVGDFLSAVQDTCRECDVLFVLDEMVTGFRIAYGGGQEYFGIKPDLATLGKACGGGLPIGVIAGREDVMRMFLEEEGRESVFTGGTFSGNPLSMAAGTAAVRYLFEHPEVYRQMEQQGDRLTRDFNKFAQDHDIPVHMSNVGSMFHIYFQREPVKSSFDIDEEPLAAAKRAFLMHALNLGVLISGGNRYYLSVAHTEEVVGRIIDVFKESLILTREDGLL